MGASPGPSENSSQSEAYLVGRWFAASRRQGLLAAVPPEAWHTLSAVLSFTGRDGRRSFTPDQLALALTQSREEALRRLEALSGAQWQGQPLLALEKDATGAIVGAALGPSDLLTRIPVADQPPPHGAMAPAASPTAAVPAGTLEAALVEVGLTADQAAWLIAGFPEERIRRQLAWLPRRQARNPAAFLLRAVEQDWSAPRGLPPA